MTSNFTPSLTFPASWRSYSLLFCFLIRCKCSPLELIVKKTWHTASFKLGIPTDSARGAVGFSASSHPPQNFEGCFWTWERCTFWEGYREVSSSTTFCSLEAKGIYKSCSHKLTYFNSFLMYFICKKMSSCWWLKSVICRQCTYVQKKVLVFGSVLNGCT